MVVGEFTSETQVFVIGGGPGGYTAAIRAAQLGKEVILVERKRVGGVCLNEGCIPSKALITAASQFYQTTQLEQKGIRIDGAQMNLARFQEWKTREVVEKLVQGIELLCKNNKVQVINGEAYFTDQHEVRIVSEFVSQRIRFQHCIIATGSRPVELPQLPFGSRILNASNILELTHTPESLVVVGGGYIGVELGTAYAKLGTKVTIIEAADSILASLDRQLIAPVLRKLHKLGVTIYNQSTVKGYEPTESGIRLTIQQTEQEAKVEAQYCLLTVGRQPNSDQLGLNALGVLLNQNGTIQTDLQCRTSLPHLFAIGDLTEGPALAHKASYEGKVAAEVIAGCESLVDYQAMPAVIFSDPEIAVVGISEQQAKEQGLQVRVGKFPFTVNGRALSAGATEGFVKVIATSDGFVRGVSIVGEHASELIGEAALAIEMGAKVEDLAMTIHPHPTMGEGLLEASEALLKKAIHMVNH